MSTQLQRGLPVTEIHAYTERNVIEKAAGMFLLGIGMGTGLLLNWLVLSAPKVFLHSGVIVAASFGISLVGVALMLHAGYSKTGVLKLRKKER